MKDENDAHNIYSLVRHLVNSGSTTRHGLRKGNLVKSPQGIGYVSGDTEKQVSVSNANWKQLGQIASSKVQLIRRSNGLYCCLEDL